MPSCTRRRSSSTPTVVGRWLCPDASIACATVLERGGRPIRTWSQESACIAPISMNRSLWWLFAPIACTSGRACRPVIDQSADVFELVRQPIAVRVLHRVLK